MKNILPLITGYVFIHKLFHAYFDKYHMPKVKEIEEAMAEYASLDFLENTHNTCHDIAYEMVSLKKEIVYGYLRTDSENICIRTTSPTFG